MDFAAELSARQLWDEFRRLRVEVSCLRTENQGLREKLAGLQGEVARLQRTNLELRQQTGYWQNCHRRAIGRIEQLQKTIERLEAEKRQQKSEFEQTIQRLEAEKRQLKDDLFGRQTEKRGPDRSNELEDRQQQEQRQRQRGQQAGQRGPKRRDYSHLETRPEDLALPAEACVCEQCGKRFAVLSDTEDSELIEIEVRPHRRLLRRRRYRRTCTCPGQRTFTAPSVPKLIPKGRLGVSVWVEILLDKYWTYRPTERLLASWRLCDLDLAMGTVTDGLQRLEALLLPVYQAIEARGKQQGTLYQADETRWLMFIDHKGKENHCWWLWVFGNAETVVYVLDPRRSHEVPETYLPTDRTVVLMVDRYSAYKAMPLTKQGLVLLAFCWAHVRRDFIRVGKGWLPLKGWALEWLKRIRELYQLNRQRLKALPQSPASSQADAALREAVAGIEAQAATELADPQLHSACRKTLVSLQEHGEGLTRFVDDPRIPMDNNGMERRLRGPTVGRKNFYGSAAEWSGRLAATLFSIAATFNLWNLNPRRWLTWYFQSCAANDGKAPENLEPFLPWNLSAAQQEALRDHADNSS
jgi:transposase